MVPLLVNVIGQLLTGNGAMLTEEASEEAESFRGPPPPAPPGRERSAETASASDRSRAAAQPAALLLAEYPDRYPTNLSHFRTLLQVRGEGRRRTRPLITLLKPHRQQAPPLGMLLTSVKHELVELPQFVNEMLDIPMDELQPSVKTDFLMFEAGPRVK